MNLKSVTIHKGNLSLYLIGALLSAAAGIAVPALRSNISVILWYLLFAVVILPVFVDRVILRRPIDVFEPVYLSSLIYLINFVGPLAMSIFLGVDHPLFPQMNFNSVLIFTTIGLLFFYLGYYLVRPSMVKPCFSPYIIGKPQKWSRTTLVFVAGVYCGITILSFAWFWFPIYGGLEGYLAMLYGVGAVDYAFQGLGYPRALLFLAVSAFHLTFLNMLFSSKSRSKIVDWGLVVITGLTSTTAMLLTGNRVLILWSLGVPLIIWHYYKRRLSLVVVAGSLALAFVVVLGYTHFIRSPSSINLASRNAVSELISFYVIQTGEPHVVSDLIDRRESTIDYQYGETLLAALMNPIPRAWYPTKLPTAGEIYTRYFHQNIWRYGATFMGMPWVGELYLNGGPVGVILGMTVTGILSGILWEKMQRLLIAKRSLTAIYAYAIALFCLYFLVVRGSLHAISFPLVWFIPVSLGLWVIRVGKRKKGLTAS